MSKLLKSTFVVSSMTLISRVLGLLRDIVFASVIGSGAVADIFFVAFRIPNLFRRIFAEGAFSLAFVPVFSSYYSSQDERQLKAFVNRVAGWLALVLLLVTLLGMLGAPYILSLTGFNNSPEKLDQAVNALRIMFPYLFFVSMVALSSGILNTYEKFAVSAFTPVFLNICLIITALFFVKDAAQPAVILGIGVTVSGLLQFLFQIPFLRSQAILPKPCLRRTANEIDQQSEDGVKKVIKLMVPTMIGASVSQINVIVNTVIASFLVTGSVSWLYYSDRLVEFPLGMFGIAISVVILPNLSKKFAEQNPEHFSNLLDWAVRLSILVVLPCVVGLYLLSESMLTTMFQYNAFTSHDVSMSALSLRGYVLGLMAMVFAKVLAPGFYARQNTKTPVKIALVAMLVNIPLALTLAHFMQHMGLALAVSISAWVNAILLYIMLYRDHIYRISKRTVVVLIKVCLACAFMGMALYLTNPDTAYWNEADLLSRVFKLTVLIIMGAGIYTVCLLLLRVNLKKLLDHGA